MNPTSERFRVPMLDVLRAVAIGAVFVQHLGDGFRPFVLGEASRVLPGGAVAWLGSILTHGHWGVDLFFVLSGFTLGLGFVRERDSGTPRSTMAFFTRRAARVLPAFYVALAVHLLAHPQLLQAPAIGSALAVHAGLLQGYLAPGRIVLIGASWSLTTEAHFYVLAPLLATWLLGSRRLHPAPRVDSPSVSTAARPARPETAVPHSPSSSAFPRPEPVPYSSAPRLRDGGAAWSPARLVVFTLASILSVWLVRGVLHDLALMPDAHPGLLELSQRRWVICRVDQFALGMACALVHVRLGERLWARPAFAYLACFVAVALLGMAAPLDDATWLRPGGGPAYAVVSLAMALLVLGAAGAPQRASSRVLFPLRFIGVVSYGVFLYHQLAIELVRRWMPGAAGEPAWATLVTTAIAAGTLAVGAGWLSWTLVESPLLAKATAFTRRSEKPLRAY